MDIKQYTTLAVGLIVAVLLVSGLMVPVIGTVTEDSTQVTTREYVNDGPYFSLVGDDGTVHTILVSLQDDRFIVTTDGVETRELEMYVPQTTGVAPAVAIGVYEAYNNSGVLTSQSGRTPTADQTIDAFRTQALAGNTDVTEGTYQLWNFYQYTLMKMMGLTVMGNTDSQYMMGPGISGGNSAGQTGSTTSAYQKSTSDTTAESLFVENGWGSLNEFVGDVNFNDRVMSAGNTLGGNAIAYVEGVNTSVTLPSNSDFSSDNYICTISMVSDVFGVPLTFGPMGTAGACIGDSIYEATGQTLLYVGGDFYFGADAGLSFFDADAGFDNSAADSIGSRLAYVMTGAGDMSADYGYVVTFDTSSGQTVISNVEVQNNGGLVSAMPTGTTLNPYWDFDTTTGVGPFGAYYVAINLSSGANADDSTEARLSTQKGEIAYRLNPNNLHQTLAGTTFDPTLYNVMIVIPTAYWYSDPATNKLYIGSSADKFDGITMAPYAHSYTIDPDVDTGNPAQTVTYASTSLVMGGDSIVRLYANGEVNLITTDSTILMGTVAEGTDVSFTITDSTLGYGGSTHDGMLAYVSNEGEMVYAHNPVVVNDSKIIIGGVTNDLDTTLGGSVTIGYCVDATYESLADATINVLNPVSDTISYVSTDMTVNTTDIDEDAVRIDSILFQSTWSDDSVSTATYTYFLAPATITIEDEEHTSVSGTLGTLLSVIPLITVVGLVISAVAFIRFKE